MKKLFSRKLILLMVILFVGSGECFKCYVCRSDEDPHCTGEDLNKSNAVECPEKEGAKGTYCRKIQQELRFKEETPATIRECAYEKGSQGCYKFQWYDIAYQEICECDSEMCNRGGNCKTSTLTLMASIFLWVFNHLTAE